MSGFGYQRKWLRAGKILEYYIDGGPWTSSYKDAEYQLYHAVIDGEIRARHNGKPFEGVSELRGKSFADGRLYVLPFDLELNIEDVERIWDWSKYDLADLLARGLVYPASAEMRMETNNLNIKTLLNRVRVRLNAMPLKSALEETEFHERWIALVREQDLLIGSALITGVRSSELKSEYELFKRHKETLIEHEPVFPVAETAKGRKPTYDWRAASEHIKSRFEHHGSLSSDDPQWSCQADVEREIQRYFLREISREPATSTVRKHAKWMICQYQGDKGKN